MGLPLHRLKASEGSRLGSRGNSRPPDLPSSRGRLRFLDVAGQVLCGVVADDIPRGYIISKSCDCFPPLPTPDILDVLLVT